MNSAAIMIGRLEEHVRKTFPKSCGIYVFINRQKKVLYTGKSLDLQKRVLSYFTKAKAEKPDKKTQELLAHTGRIEYMVTGDELKALVIEDDLIKKYLPEFNIRQKNYRSCKYIFITRSLFPSIRIIGSNSRIKKGLIYGPIRNNNYVDNLISLIQRFYKVRICSDTSPSVKCLYYDINCCMGPCVTNLHPMDYAHAINKTIQFLQGNAQNILGSLYQELATCSERLEYEKAEHIRKLLDLCKSFTDQQKFYHQFCHHTVKIDAKNQGSPSYVFVRGKMIDDTLEQHQLELFKDMCSKSDKSNKADRRAILDRSSIVFDWINRNTRKKNAFTIEILPD